MYKLKNNLIVLFAVLVTMLMVVSVALFFKYKQVTFSLERVATVDLPEDLTEVSFSGNISYPIPIRSEANDDMLYFLLPRRSEVLVLEESDGAWVKSIDLGKYMKRATPVSAFITKKNDLIVSFTDGKDTKVGIIDLNTIEITRIIDLGKDLYLSILGQTQGVAYDSNDNYFYWDDLNFSLKPINKPESLENCKFFTFTEGVCGLANSSESGAGKPDSYQTININTYDGEISLKQNTLTLCYLPSSPYAKEEWNWCGDLLGYLAGLRIISAENKIVVYNSEGRICSLDLPALPSDFFQVPNRVALDENKLFFLSQEQDKYVLYKLEIGGSF